MKNFILKDVGGNLANQLYFCLHAYILSKNTNDSVYYIANDACKNLKLNFQLDQLNVKKYFSIVKNKHADNIIGEQYNYYQLFNIDFSEEQLNEFICETILQSIAFKKTYDFKVKIQNENSMAIHIRNCDYLDLPEFNCFDRMKYLNTCLSYINVDNSPHQYKKLYVISDDINICQEKYASIFENKFSSIEYLNSDPVTDLIRLSMFKCKILWNSTFSFWGGYISNALYTNNHYQILAPSAFTQHDNNASHCNPKWPIINTPLI